MYFEINFYIKIPFLFLLLLLPLPFLFLCRLFLSAPPSRFSAPSVPSFPPVSSSFSSASSSSSFMDFASYQAHTLGLSVEYQSLARYFQSGGSGFHAYVSFFPHHSADASRDFTSGSSLFLCALHSLASAPLSALPHSSGLFASLCSSSFCSGSSSSSSAFPFPPATIPLPSAPPLGISTPSVRPPPGFPSGFSALPYAPVFPSLASTVPPEIPSTFSASSSLSVCPSAPDLNAYLGGAAPAVPVAAPAVPVAASVVPAAAPAFFRPFAVSVSAEAPLALSAPAVFASAAVVHPELPSGVPPVPPHSLASPASVALPSASAFTASPVDLFDPGFPDSVPWDPEVPIPPVVPDSLRVKMRRMYSYLVDLFPQAAGSPSIDLLPRALFEDFFTSASTPQQPIYLNWFADADTRLAAFLASVDLTFHFCPHARRSMRCRVTLLRFGCSGVPFVACFV